MNGRWITRPGKHTKNSGKSQILIGTSTISMVIFNSYVKLPEGNYKDGWINYMDGLINPVAGGCICLCVVYLWMDGWMVGWIERQTPNIDSTNRYQRYQRWIPQVARMDTDSDETVETMSAGHRITESVWDFSVFFWCVWTWWIVHIYFLSFWKVKDPVFSHFIPFVQWTFMVVLCGLSILVGGLEH